MGEGYCGVLLGFSVGVFAIVEPQVKLCIIIYGVYLLILVWSILNLNQILDSRFCGNDDLK